jgi:predicted RNase H-like HicB family nuclease
MTEAERYAITVRKVCVEDADLWRATVRELPDVAEFADTRDEAIEIILDTINNLRAAASEEGRSFPEPIEDEEEFSGRVTLRMPKSLHRAVAGRAQEEDVSINSYIVTALATTLGQASYVTDIATSWAAPDVIFSVAGAGNIGINTGPVCSLYEQRDVIPQQNKYGMMVVQLEVDDTPVASVPAGQILRHRQLRQRA